MPVRFTADCLPTRLVGSMGRRGTPTTMLRPRASVDLQISASFEFALLKKAYGPPSRTGQTVAAARKALQGAARNKVTS